MELLEPLRDAHALARSRVAGIKPEQWELPTPCGEWTVGDVARHLVVGMEWYETLLLGTDTLQTQARILAITITPASAAVMLDDASDRLLALFDVDTLARPIPYPGLQPFDGSDLARFSVFECCVHSWDLAQALGVDGAFGEELARIGYDGAAPFIDRIRESGLTKAPTTDRTAGNSAQAGLLHLFGRTPEHSQ